jgi:hypothetical protein
MPDTPTVTIPLPETLFEILRFEPNAADANFPIPSAEIRLMARGTR